MENYKRVSHDNIKEYLVTTDPKRKNELKNTIFYEFKPMAERIVLNLNINYIDKDDLFQIAYEALILLINEIKTDINFNTLLHNKIRNQINKYAKDYMPIAVPISEVEIQSNFDVDEYVVNKVHTERLYKIFNEELKNYDRSRCYERDIEIFRKHHGTVDEPMTEKALAKMFKISDPRVHQILVYVRSQIRSQIRRRLYRAYVDVDRIYEEYDTAREYNDIEHEHSYTKIKK